jgi:hypothetical protein
MGLCLEGSGVVGFLNKWNELYISDLQDLDGWNTWQSF